MENILWLSIIYSKLLSILSIRQSSPIERYNTKIGRLLRTFCSDNHETWSLYIIQIVQFLNETVTFILSYHTQFLETLYHLIYYPEYNKHMRMMMTVSKKEDLSCVTFRKEKKNDKHQQKIQINDFVNRQVHKLSSTINKKIHIYFFYYYLYRNHT